MGFFTTHPMDVVNVRVKVGLVTFLTHLKLDLELLIQRGQGYCG